MPVTYRWWLGLDSPFRGEYRESHSIKQCTRINRRFDRYCNQGHYEHYEG